MDAPLVLQAAVGAPALDDGGDLLDPPGAGLREVDHLHPPPLLLGVAAVHAEQLGGEQRRLVAARAGADLQHHVALVVGVLGGELAPQPLLELRDAGRELLLLLLHHLVQVVVLGQRREHLLVLRPLLLDLHVLAVELDRRIDLRQRLVQLAVRLGVREDGRIGEPLRQLLMGLLQLGQFFDHGREP